MDSILEEESPQYSVIRRHYSHFFHGHGRSGSVVLYIRPGYSTISDLWKESVPILDSHLTLQRELAILEEGRKKAKRDAKRAKKGRRKNKMSGKAQENSAQESAPHSSDDLTLAHEDYLKAGGHRRIVADDLVRHHVFMLESLFSRWGPEVEGKTGERTTLEMQQLVAVFDLDKFAFSQLKSFFGVFKRVVKILEQHCKWLNFLSPAFLFSSFAFLNPDVGRADKIVILNAPNFRNIAYLVFPLIPPQVKAKIEILGRGYQKRLREILLPVRKQ